MQIKIKTGAISLITLLIIIIPLLTGCSGHGEDNRNAEGALKSDAVMALKSTYAEDFSRITIIRGALYKFTVNPQNPQLLGTAVGATEAAVFPEQYELKRFSKLENLSAEMRKEIISQPMLNITLKKREVLNHIYTAVLKPLSENVGTGKQAAPQEIAVVNNLISLLDTAAQDYSVLSNSGVDLNGGEAQQAFLSMQNTFREMQKLQLVKQVNRQNQPN